MEEAFAHYPRSYNIPSVSDALVVSVSIIFIITILHQLFSELPSLSIILTIDHRHRKNNTISPPYPLSSLLLFIVYFFLPPGYIELVPFLMYTAVRKNIRATNNPHHKHVDERLTPSASCAPPSNSIS